MACNNTNKSEIYFDNNATTKPLTEVKDAVLKILGDDFGNPSSAHSSGERARNFLNESREKTSDLIGCCPDKIIFTSSGTESNNMAFYSCTKKSNGNSRIITTKVEHSSIQKMCSYLRINDVEVEMLEVDSKGFLILEELEKTLDKNDVDLVSVQWVNNETGVIQDIESIASICKEKGVLFHTDAAQAVGKLKMDLEQLSPDFLSFTGHKYNALQGCGVLFANDRFLVHPVFYGGFQEEGFRPGTENLPGIVGIGKASEVRCRNLEKHTAKMKELRNRFEAMILDFIPGTRVNGCIENRVCNTTNIKFGEIDGRRLIQLLDKRGLRCSQSSACTNFDTAPSYVLLAMGLSEKEAYSSIRFSFSPQNNVEEVDRAVEIIRESCANLHKH